MLGVAAPGQSLAQSRLPAGPSALHRRGVEAVERREWDEAIGLFEAALDAAPYSPRILEDLGAAHSQADHDVAAIAWFHAALAADPGLSSRKGIENRIEVLHGVVNAKLRRIYEEAGRIRGELTKDRLPSGGLRDYVRLAVVAEIAMGEWIAAQTAMEVIPAEHEQADIWAQITTAFMTTYADLETAGAAVERIADPLQRETLRDAIARTKAAAPDQAGSSPLLKWISLAKFLSRRPLLSGLEAALQRATEAPLAEVPLRILEVGTALAIDYMKVWRLEGGRP